MRHELPSCMLAGRAALCAGQCPVGESADCWACNSVAGLPSGPSPPKAGHSPSCRWRRGWGGQWRSELVTCVCRRPVDRQRPSSWWIAVAAAQQCAPSHNGKGWLYKRLGHTAPRLPATTPISIYLDRLAVLLRVAVVELQGSQASHSSCGAQAWMHQPHALGTRAAPSSNPPPRQHMSPRPVSM